MPYITELEKTNFGVVDTLSREHPEETIVYIHIGGKYQDELEEALNSLYVDNQREFKLVDIKKQSHLVSALLLLEPKKREPIKF